MDNIDKKIIDMLKENSRLSFQIIGKRLFLTGQAVSARVHKLEELKIITGYTITQKNNPISFIIIYMKKNNFEDFEKFIISEKVVKDCHKIIGQGCYQIIVSTNDNLELEKFLNKCLYYGTYSVSTSIKLIK